MQYGLSYICRIQPCRLPFILANKLWLCFMRLGLDIHRRFNLYPLDGNQRKVNETLQYKDKSDMLPYWNWINVDKYNVLLLKKKEDWTIRAWNSTSWTGFPKLEWCNQIWATGKLCLRWPGYPDRNVQYFIPAW